MSPLVIGIVILGQTPLFVKASSPPKYANRAARLIMEKTFRIYESPRGMRYRVSSTEGVFAVWFQAGKAKQSGSRVEWLLADGTLSILDRQKLRFASGRSGKSKLSTYLSRFNTRIEPTLWQLLYRRNPIRALLDADLKVTKSGKIVFRGVPCWIMIASGLGARISMLISIQDGIVYRVTADVTNSKGKIVSTSDRVFSNVNLGPQPPEAFKLQKPAHFQAGSLPLLKT